MKQHDLCFLMKVIFLDSMLLYFFYSDNEIDFLISCLKSSANKLSTDQKKKNPWSDQFFTQFSLKYFLVDN